MIAVVQRVTRAAVTVDGKTVGAIGKGLLVLAAIEAGDGPKQIGWMARKIVGLRVFRSPGKHFDRDLQQVGGAVLLVSNFTVAADCQKGRRPSLDPAAAPAAADSLFSQFVEAVKYSGVPVQTGMFGGDMCVEIVNDGPASFILKSES